jgi:septation ring formation regulator EzrA
MKWQLKISFFWCAVAFLLLVSLVPSFGESYLITNSELAQLKTECSNLNLELSILKANSDADEIALRSLSEKVMSLNESIARLQENLTDTENALILASGQSAEARIQLAELKTSLDKLKRANLLVEIKTGTICGGVGIAIGIITGLVIGSYSSR